MKALIAALALVTLIAGPTFAQSANTAEPEVQTNVSPASPRLGITVTKLPTNLDQQSVEGF
jgi:hypothetical protein